MVTGVLSNTLGRHGGSVAEMRTRVAPGRRPLAFPTELLLYVIDRMDPSDSWRLLPVCRVVFHHLSPKLGVRNQRAVAKLATLNEKLASPAGWDAVVRFCMPSYARKKDDAKRAEAMRVALPLFARAHPKIVPLGFYRMEQLLNAMREEQREAAACVLVNEAWSYSPEWGETVLRELASRVPTMGGRKAICKPLIDIVIGRWDSGEDRPQVARSLGHLVQIWSWYAPRSYCEALDMEPTWQRFLSLLPFSASAAEMPFAAGMLLSAERFSARFRTTAPDRFLKQLCKHSNAKPSERDRKLIDVDVWWDNRVTPEEKIIREADASARAKRRHEKSVQRSEYLSQRVLLPGN
jgi:hypothetical protein